MKLLLFYSCLLAILFQAISASLSLDGNGATLKSKKPGCPKRVKKVGSKSGKKALGRKLPKKKRAGKRSKDSTAAEENKPKLLSAILPKTLVEIVIGYFKEDFYSTLVSTHDWLLQDEPRIAVDSARLYVMTNSGGLNGLNHSAASLKEDERLCIDFGDPQSSNHRIFSGSHDGRYVLFAYSYEASTDRGEQTRSSFKWLAQSNELEGEKFKPVAFDNRDLIQGFLSRNGQRAFFYAITNVTRVYQIAEETGDGPTAFMKFELSGELHAVSGNGNRVMVKNEQYEIHDISKDASELVCRVSVIDCMIIHALNEDGSEVAYVNYAGQLRIVDVNKIDGDKVDSSAMVTVSGPIGPIFKLVYSDGNKLHVLHHGGGVSLFDSPTKTLIPIETPQVGQMTIRSTTSPNADYITGLQYLGRKENKRVYRTTVKRKAFTADDLRNVLGYVADKAASNGKSSEKQVKEDGGASSAANRSFQAAKKKLARNRKRALKKRPKKRVGATKGVTSASAGKSNQGGSAAQDDFNTFVLDFPKELVELIGGYLGGFYSVVFTRDWSAVYSWGSVAVDSERHYLITDQDVQASSHGDGKPVSFGSPGLYICRDFQSSHDGCSVFFTSKSQGQISSYSLGKTIRWLVQETGTKDLKSITVEGGEISNNGNKFMLSANGKALVSTFLRDPWDTGFTTVYQIEEHGKALAFKKGGFNGEAGAVSGNGNRILLKCKWKWQLEIYDISKDRSNLVLKINYPRATNAWSCALNSDGSKAAFIDTKDKLYIVDVSKEKSSISVDQLTPIDIPSSIKGYDLIYDAKDRLYAFGSGSLWLVDPLKSELVSLEKAEVPQGHVIQDEAISPNVDYIASLFRSKNENENGKDHFQMVVKRREEVTKDALMRFFRYES